MNHLSKLIASRRKRLCASVRAMATLAAVCIALTAKAQTAAEPDSLPLPEQIPVPVAVAESPENEVVIGQPVRLDADGQLVDTAAADTIAVVAPTKVPGPLDDFDVWEERTVEFNPSPTRAVWLSALFPGLGQIYNRRYWKLPIIVGGYLGLGYATSWNNTMLSDYSRAYRDILDSDPNTKSYMNLFPPTVKEDDLDKNWLTNLLKSRKDYFRRNRDLCVICMVGVYLLAMVDAYVDASLSHFDISPDLSIDWSPSIMQDGRNKLPSIGLNWALNF